MYRIGHGFDVHQFGEGRRCVLGGVDIPYGLGLVGHSDADVVAHAVADALLGAARLGDIGELFPDTDPRYAGADSMVLLSDVAHRVRGHGLEVVDVDVTVAAEAPKLKPHRLEMRQNLASAMGIATDAVGLKATTTEGLGFVGRREGIACWAVCLLEEADGVS